MRSFTKKNVPYNNSIYQLLYSTNPNIVALRNALDHNNFKQANAYLINLTNNATVSGFIDEHRNAIKDVYVALAVQNINGAAITVANFTAAGGFTGGVPNANWPGVNVAGDIMPTLNALEPNDNTIDNFLTGMGGNNNVDISNLAAPYNVAAGTVTNIAILLVLKQLLRAAKLRSEYENLFSFDYHDNGVNGRVIRINHFFYNSTLANSKQKQHSSSYTANNHLLNQINRNATNNNIVVGQLAVILGIAPNHVRFTNVPANLARWVRQGMGNSIVSDYILLSVAEAKQLMADFINSNAQLISGQRLSTIAKNAGPNGTPDATRVAAVVAAVNAAFPGVAPPFAGVVAVAATVTSGVAFAFNHLTPVQQQGVRLLNYIQRHSANSLKKIINNKSEETTPERGYRLAKLALVKAQGLYCAFCESPLVDGRNSDIEHKLPKSVFPTEALDWENLVLACKICDSDNKSTRFVDHTHAVNNGIQDFTEFHFNPGGGKNYINYRNGSREETLWPDLRHPAIPAAAHQVNSFNYVDYNLLPGPGGAPIAFGLNNINTNTQAFVHIANLGAGNTYQIDIINLNGVPNQPNVRAEMINHATAPANVGGQGIQASIDHIRDICGLNNIGASFWNDQRMVARTKTWLYAMKQLKILSTFHDVRFRALYSYYDQHLHPYAIKALSSIISGFRRDDTGAAMGLRNIVSTDANNSYIAIVNHNIPDGEVDIDIAAFIGMGAPNAVSTSANFGIQSVAGNVAGANITAGRITGNKTTVGGNSQITGSIDIETSNTAHLTDRIIFFKDVNITWVAAANQTQIEMNHAVIPVNNGNPYRGLLRDWDQKRDQLLKFLDRADKFLLSYIWENILDMVRLGGFYSTWVRTFQHNRPIIAGNAIAFDIDLVRHLEIKARENPEDPFQFHNTDAAEIINSL